jgi:hypothetical protein
VLQPRAIPWGTFWLGGLVAVALGIPATTLALLALARLVGVGDRTASIEELARLAAVFAAFPAFVTGGGVARRVAHLLVERAPEAAAPTARRLYAAAALLMAFAGIGLAVLIAVPAGGMPAAPLRWLALVPAGALAGGATGLAIAWLTTYRMRRLAGGEEATS